MDIFSMFFNGRFFRVKAKGIKKQEPVVSTPEIQIPSLILKDFFAWPEIYNPLMDLCVARKLCTPGFYIWIDSSKSNKGFLVGFLKYLHVQGYYKDNRRLTNKQIMEICLSTFGMIICIDTVKQNTHEDHDYSFIPHSSELLSYQNT